MAEHPIHGPALFTAEGPAHYAAAYNHNRPFAKPGPWFTKLGTTDEADFRAWVKSQDVPFDPDESPTDYDMRGFWEGVIKTGQHWDGGHFPDTWKTPYDTSFSNQSRYAAAGCPFKWRGEILVDVRSGQVVFNEGGKWPMTGAVKDDGQGGGKTPAAQPKVPERFIPGIHSVQGINSTVHDLKIKGESFVARIGDAIAEMVLTRTTRGASTLTVTIFDPSPSRRLLRSPLLEEANELILDGLRWKLAKVTNQGINSPIVLTYEPLVVYVLKRLFGPHKSFRDQMTRAEFARLRWLEGVNPSLAAKIIEAEVTKGEPAVVHRNLPKVPGARFVSPELHVVQPIGSAKEGREREQEKKEERGKGVGENPGNLKVNGKPATDEQVKILNRMLQVAESLSSPTKVMEALVVTCIDESVVGTLSSNLLEQEPFIGVGTDHTNPEESAKGFLSGYKTADGKAVGALAFFKANPGASVAEICTAVQNNRDGATPYERFLDEGKTIVAAYGGGSEIATTDFERYAFEQGKKVSNWAIMNKLAGAVHWRCFESAGWTYFLDEPTLLRSPNRMLVSDAAPGIIDTTFDYDVDKEVQTMTVEAMANTWGAPPGSLATVDRHGPADGIYIVEQIESKPGPKPGIVQIALSKPTAALPEPLPSREGGKASFGGTGDSTSGAPSKVQAIINAIDKVDAAKPPYSHAGHGTEFAALGSTTDCSGFVSQILHAAGYLSVPLTSAQFAEKFPAGEGEWVTIYGDAEHVVMKVKYPDGNWRGAATASENGGGAGWISDEHLAEEEKLRGNACHPPGL